MKEKWYTQWEAFGKRIQLTREKADITREQLAHAIGLSKENLRRIDFLLLGTQPSNEDDAAPQQTQTDKEQIYALLQNLSPMQMHFACQFLNASIQFFNSFLHDKEI